MEIIVIWNEWTLMGQLSVASVITVILNVRLGLGEITSKIAFALIYLQFASSRQYSATVWQAGVWMVPFCGSKSNKSRLFVHFGCNLSCALVHESPCRDDLLQWNIEKHHEKTTRDRRCCRMFFVLLTCTHKMQHPMWSLHSTADRMFAVHLSMHFGCTYGSHNIV